MTENRALENRIVALSKEDGGDFKLTADEKEIIKAVREGRAKIVLSRPDALPVTFVDFINKLFAQDCDCPACTAAREADKNKGN